MLQPFKSGSDLIEEIDRTFVPAPTLWWLGQSGFVIRFASITFYIDVCFSELEGRKRLIAAPLAGGEVNHADMIFSTHAHAAHLDPSTVVPMLAASRRA